MGERLRTMKDPSGDPRELHGLGLIVGSKSAVKKVFSEFHCDATKSMNWPFENEKLIVCGIVSKRCITDRYS